MGNIFKKILRFLFSPDPAVIRLNQAQARTREALRRAQARSRAQYYKFLRDVRSFEDEARVWEQLRKNEIEKQKTIANNWEPTESRLPASTCSTRYCEVCGKPFSEPSKELQGELRELFKAVKTCAKCCQQKLQEAYEKTMVD